MKSLHLITWTLLVIGGLNWGLSVFDWDLAHWGIPMNILNVIYILVGVSALYELFTHGQRCRMCKPDGGMNKPM